MDEGRKQLGARLTALTAQRAKLRAEVASGRVPYTVEHDERADEIEREMRDVFKQLTSSVSSRVDAAIYLLLRQGINVAYLIAGMEAYHDMVMYGRAEGGEWNSKQRTYRGCPILLNNNLAEDEIQAVGYRQCDSLRKEIHSTLFARSMSG